MSAKDNDKPHFDIVLAADPRFRGGTGSAIRTEIIAAHRWGMTCAFLPYHGMKERPSFGFAPRVQAALEQSDITLLRRDEAASCDILFAHHPFVFEFLPLTRPRVQPKVVVAVLHHPPIDGDHSPQYNIERLISSLIMTFNAPVKLAPVGPVVRRQLVMLGIDPNQILDHDLTNIIDDAEWQPRQRPAPQDHVVIGRHSRKDPLKWPDRAEDIQLMYPEREDVTIRVLGEPYFPEGMQRPSNLYALEFTETGVSDFLQSLDFYVYFHSDRWVEAFGIAIAESLACGLVVILPPSFEPVFGPAAIYAEPAKVMPLIERFRAEPDEYRRQSKTARRIALAHFGMAGYGKRIETLYRDVGQDLPHPMRLRAQGEISLLPQVAPMLPGPARTRVLMVATNGMGLGHVTRLMAIAKYLPNWIEPIFLTLSLATDLVRQAGYAADYIPSFGKAGVKENSWNDVFAMELATALNATGAQGVIFDSNHPFPGLLKVLKKRKDLAWVWIRRGMWQPHHKLSHQMQRHFDLLLEPSELARAHDGGPTAKIGRALEVGPILLTEPGERVSRTQAAKRLEVDPGATNVFVQLGSRQNMGFEEIRTQLSMLLPREYVHVYEIANPLAPVQDSLDQVEERSVYPLAKYSKAIDLLITTAGYNGFHETIYHQIPTLFVPNEAPEMDHQLLRAHYAKLAGLAEMIRNSDAPRLNAVLDHCLSADFRDQVKTAGQSVEFTSGARASAVAISEQLASVRTNRPLSLALPIGH